MSERLSIKPLVREAKRGETVFAKQAPTKDSYQNFAAKLGMGTDNLATYSTYGFNPITRIRMMLEWIHRGSWLGGVAVDAVADDMTKAGIKLHTDLDPAEIAHIEEVATQLCVWDELRDNIAWTRLYGGSIAVILIEGQKMSTPLRLDTVGKGMFKGLVTLDRWMVEPSLGDLVTEFGPNLGMPKFYTVSANSPALIGERIHYSRVIRGRGIKLPFQQRMTENLWSISIYERMYDRMVAYDSTTQGMAQSVYKSYLRTVRMKDLRENIAAGGNQMDGVLQYIQMMARFQSIEGITMLDLEDEFQEGGANNFMGLREVLMSIGEQLAGAMDPAMPLVRMFGMSPAGFSTGDTDLRNWYDSVNKEQERKLKIPVTNIYRCIAQSEGIEVPEGFSVEFVPLWQLSETEKASIATQVSGFVSQAREQGVIKPDLALKELKQSSDITGYWSNITDQDIKDAEEEGPPMPTSALTAQETEGTAPGEKQPQKSSSKTGPSSSASKDAANVIAELARLHDLHVVVENPAGSIRRGIGWESIMPDDYGYIRRNEGADGDAIDVFVGKNAHALNAYVIDQRDLRTGLFDEHKVCLGYPSAGAAIESYLLAYDDGDGNPERIMNVTPLTIEEFKYWLQHSSQSEPCAGSYVTLDARFREDEDTTQDFAEGKVKRGKTTPGSTPGSFAPAGGGAGKSATPAHSNSEHTEHAKKLGASKAKLDALKSKHAEAKERGGVSPKLREALAAAREEYKELAATPPFGAKQNDRNIDRLVDLLVVRSKVIANLSDAVENANGVRATKAAEAALEAAEQEPYTEIQYTSEAAMKKVQRNDKERGFDWSKEGQQRLMVVAPEDRSEWPLHCLGFMSDGTKIQGVPEDATDVFIGLNEDSALFATYMPSNGGDRKPVYHPDYKGQSKAIGDERVRGMKKDLPGIKAAVENALKHARGLDKEHAFVQALNLHTLIRTGNEDQKTANKVQRDKNAENYGEILEKGKQTYGLTTLQSRHVKERKDGLHLKFDGKMGEDVDILVTDPAMVKGLRARVDPDNPKAQLFPDIDDESLRKWREGVSIGNGRALAFYKIHDIRSRVATDEALKLIAKMPKPLNAAEWLTGYKKVIAHVGPMLGHKPKGMVTATSYIIPDVWNDPIWKKHEDPKIMAKIRKAHGEA